MTIKDVDSLNNRYRLAIPNKEVYTGLLEQLLPFVTGKYTATNDSFILRLSDALDGANIDAALKLLRSYLASIPYDLAAKTEKEFQAQLYVLLNSLDLNIRSEVRISNGRIDFALDNTSDIYIFGIKFNKSAEFALAQIWDKNYTLAYKQSEKHITLLGINFDSKKRTIDENWIIQQLK